jgi:hypothetical protein
MPAFLYRILAVLGFALVLALAPKRRIAEGTTETVPA